MQENQPASKVILLADRAQRIYVAGPMSGILDFNFSAFRAAAEMLRGIGWQVENPADSGQVDGAEWADYMAYDLTRLGLCGAIYLLPGWSKSKGATEEKRIADFLGLKVLYADGAELCSSCDGSGEYTDSLGDWRGYCHCQAGITAKAGVQ